METCTRCDGTMVERHKQLDGMEIRTTCRLCGGVDGVAFGKLMDAAKGDPMVTTFLRRLKDRVYPSLEAMLLDLAVWLLHERHLPFWGYQPTGDPMPRFDHRDVEPTAVVGLLSMPADLVGEPGPENYANAVAVDKSEGRDRTVALLWCTNCGHTFRPAEMRLPESCPRCGGRPQAQLAAEH